MTARVSHRLAQTLAVCLFVSSLGFAAPAAHAQSPIVVGEQSFRSAFPGSLRFTVAVTSTSPINVLRLTVWQRGVALGSRYTPEFQSDRQVRATFVWDLQYRGAGDYMPPGARGEYTWHIEDAAGNQYDTPHEPFEVVDTSQAWRTISNRDIAVNWYQGSPDFGLAVLTRAISARGFLIQQLNLERIDPLRIFVYADRDSFFRALPPTAREWTGGSTFPEYGVILMNFTEENLEWGLRATSHELSHAVLHARVPGYLGELVLPRWLDEGLAVYNEVENHAPDDQFDGLLRRAIRQDQLIPLRRLIQNFPPDSDSASLAYGEGYDMVRFMIEKRGADRFGDLLRAFERGTALEDAFEQVYGVGPDELENAWRQELGLAPRPVSQGRVPTAGAMPTYAVSSGFATPGAAVTPRPPSTAVAQSGDQAAPRQPPTTAPEASGAPAPGLCGGVFALAGLAGFGLWQSRKRGIKSVG